MVFDWQPVAGAISYDIRVSTDDSFNTVIDHPVVAGTRYSPAKSYDVDDYWWQVRARNIFGAAQEWTDVRVRTFHRAWVRRRSCSTRGHGESRRRRRLLLPVDPGDARHQVPPRRRSGPQLLPDVVQVVRGHADHLHALPGQVGPGSGGVDLCAPHPGVTTYWRVKALDGPGTDIQGVYSPIRAFVYDPGRVRQLTPADGSTVDVPTLSWDPVHDADKYNVVLYSSTGKVFDITTSSLSWTPTGQTQLPAAKNPYRWTVVAIDHNGDKSPLPLFGDRTFNVSGNTPTTGADPLTPLTPTAEASASLRFPRLTWEPMPGAAYYTVNVGTSGTGFFSEIKTSLGSTSAERFPYPSATDTTTASLQAGSYDWFVSAFSSSGATLGHGTLSTFSVGQLSAVSGQRVALSGRGLDGLDTSATPCAKQLESGVATIPTTICRGLPGHPGPRLGPGGGCRLLPRLPVP